MPPVPETHHQSASFGVATAPAPTLAPLLTPAGRQVLKRYRALRATPIVPDVSLAPPMAPYSDPSTRPMQVPQGPVLQKPTPGMMDAEPSQQPSAALEQFRDGTPLGAAIGVVAGAGTGLWWGKSPTAAGVGAAAGGVVGYFGGWILGGIVGGLAGYIAAKVR